MNWVTLTDGGKWHTNGRPFTTHDVVALCRALTVSLGQPVHPEPICEGGLVLSQGAGLPGYKAMRFRVSGGGEDWQWPMVGENALVAWEAAPPVIIAPRVPKGCATFFFKASAPASPWTRDELTAVQAAFEGAGFACSFTKRVAGIPARRPAPTGERPSKRRRQE